MKALKLIVVVIVLFLASAMQAQVSVNVNIGTPPPWGPAGYPEVRYYYLPDVEAYYDVQASMFIYPSGNIWIHRAYLPSRYRNYDLYGGYKVVMSDYRGNTPYANFTEHRTKYARGYHGQPQKTYGERPGKRNFRGKTQTRDHSNNNVSRGNNRNTGHNNDRNMKKNDNRGGRNGKRK